MQTQIKLSVNRAQGGSLRATHCKVPSPKLLLVARAAEATSDPMVTIEVTSPAGTFSSITTESGEIMRKTLLANKVELYQGMWAKAMNCGGAGNCGTCLVEILEGDSLLSERTNNEEKKLKGKPASWRLACQTIVGDGESSGTCKVKLGPK